MIRFSHDQLACVVYRALTLQPEGWPFSCPVRILNLSPSTLNRKMMLGSDHPDELFSKPWPALGVLWSPQWILHDPPCLPVPQMSSFCKTVEEDGCPSLPRLSLDKTGAAFGIQRLLC